jgi:hypothetical protein
MAEAVGAARSAALESGPAGAGERAQELPRGAARRRVPGRADGGRGQGIGRFAGRPPERARLERRGREAGRVRFRLLASGDALVQPYVEEIGRRGEWSFVFFGGSYSHAVLKVAAEGDFRVQHEFGGDVRVESPARSLVDAAEKVARWIPRPWAYARVDGVEVEGRLMLMELELIEPFLFLSSDPAAASRFADAVSAAPR